MRTDSPSAPRSSWFAVVMTAALAGSVSCGKATSSTRDAEPDEEIPPLRVGTLVVANGADRSVTRLQWSADAQELYYYAPRPSPWRATLKAVRPASNVIRTIDDREQYRERLVLSRDGKALLDFYREEMSGPTNVQRIALDGSGVQLIAANVASLVEHDAFYVYTAIGPKCPLESDPQSASFSFCDPMFLLSKAGGDAPKPLGLGNLLLLSPGGDQVLYMAEPCDKVGPLMACLAMLLRLSDGSSLLAGFIEPSDELFQYQWDEQGLRRLRNDFGSEWVGNVAVEYRQFVVEHLPSGVQDLLWRYDWRTNRFWQGSAWSRDGKRLIAWDEYIFLKVARSLSYLYLIDAGAGSPRRIAVVLPDDAGAVAISRDGRWSAYVAGTSIYVEDAGR